MKKIKKKLVSLALLLLLVITAVPASSVNVQAASVGKVTGLKVVFTKGKTKLTWKKASRAKKYQIYRSTNGKNYKKVKTVKSRSWTDTKKGEVWYKVRAINGSRKGAFSKAVSIYTMGGRISTRMSGNTFVNAGTSIFAIELWNYASKKPAFIGNSKDGKKMTDYPVMVYNKSTGQFISSMTGERYYHGVLSNSGGETNVYTSILSRGKGKSLIYVAGLGMVSPYVTAYDNHNLYAYYINTYFKLGKRVYQLTVSSEPTYAKEYLLQRIK